MTHALVLARRALRESIRTPEALVPALFIPLFFLVVNVGQVARIFPGSSTAFLHGQGYGAFQLPSSMLLAASFGTTAGGTWSHGDFNYDGAVNTTDFNLLVSNFGQTLASPQASALGCQLVPEPTLAATVPLSLVYLKLRSRRRLGAKD